MSTGKFIACLLALAAAGCSNSSTSPTTTSTSSVTTSESDYSGTLNVGGTLSFPITVVASGTAAINLESVTLTPTGPATTIQLGIGLAPATTDTAGHTVCGATTSSATVASALAAQLSAAVTPGSYCVSVYDPGTLTVPVTFLVRAVHP